MITEFNTKSNNSATKHNKHKTMRSRSNTKCNNFNVDLGQIKAKCVLFCGDPRKLRAYCRKITREQCNAICRRLVANLGIFNANRVLFANHLHHLESEVLRGLDSMNWRYWNFSP